MAKSDKPLEDLAAAEEKIDPPVVEPAAEPMPEPEPLLGKAHDETGPASAADRLRAFEDEHLGPDTPRHDGKVERGVGSHYSRMSEDDLAMHQKLERQVDAEQKLAEARAALSAAEAAVREAESNVNADG